MRVLIIAGDAAIARRLRRRLWRDGHIVEVAPTGSMGFEQAESEAYHAVILTLDLPDDDGVAVTRRLREAAITTPILIIATTQVLDARLQGLDAGADDYLTRPFSYAELAARLRAITRRGEWPVQEDRLVVGDLTLDRRTRTAMRGERMLKLAPKEFALLEYLMRHPGQVLSRTLLLEHVWDDAFVPDSNVVDAAIRRLRKVVDAGETRPAIRTVRGVGYKIQDGA